jgi:hypothetical protein
MRPDHCRSRRLKLADAYLFHVKPIEKAPRLFHVKPSCSAWAWAWAASAERYWSLPATCAMLATNWSTSASVVLKAVIQRTTDVSSSQT